MLETLDLVDIGCQVWERQPPESDYAPRGGTVVAIGHTADPETGEIQRQFATLGRVGGQMRLVWLKANEVDAEAAEGPNPLFVRNAWRLLAREVSKRKGTALAEEGEFLEAAVRLWRSVAVR